VIATPEQYAQMLDRAKARGFAYPAVNVTSTQTLNAALRGFTEADSDGIVQISVGGAEYFSGASIGHAVTGAVAFAEVAEVLAANHPGLVALHSDHCPPGRVDSFLRPLLAISQARVANGGAPLFQSHMWDGSSLPLEENLRLAAELLEECRRAGSVLELEIGVMGGEEDGITGAIDERLYSTPEDALRVADVLGLGERGRFLLAATFGNVHGVYQPGHIVLRPRVLREIQDAVGGLHGRDHPFDLVFHGGSGSSLDDIREAIGYGVVKMNVDTDAQYAFTRPIADHMFTRYDGVLRLEGGTGDKAAYDPRSWGRAAEASMADRVIRACRDLGSAGQPASRATERKDVS
jgi:fructose-bisphosphate aldolase class II